MNTILRKIPVLFAFVAIIFSVSCQKESEEFIDDTQEQETTSIGASLAAILISASQNNGYLDNIIDGSSCISVKLPVTVIANDQQLIINTTADYPRVQAIFDEFTNDVDYVDIQFPATVIFEQYNEIEVGNATVFNSIIDACQDTIPDTYSCAEFIYPLSCFTYNTTSEQTGLVTLANDQEWFEYLAYLGEEVLISIDYPMGVVIDGQVIRVNSNSALLQVMSEVNCDDENGIVDPEVFENKLITSQWYVNLFNESGADKTCSYVAYAFQFDAEGIVEARSDFDTRNGSWELISNNGALQLALTFETAGGNDTFVFLNSTWEIIESTAQTIKLEDGSNGASNYLYFGRSATSSCGSGNGQVLTTNLIDGQWSIAAYFDNGENKTDNYDVYELTFELGGAVVATGGVYNLYGSWTIIGDEDLELELDFGTQFPFSEFNALWEVIAFDTSSVSLRNKNGGTHELTLSKL